MPKRTLNNITFQFNQGYVSSRDSTDLGQGELISGVGGFYKPGDPIRIWKEEGRSTHFNFSGLDPSTSYEADVVKGLALCQFDFRTSGIGVSGVGQQVVNKVVAYVDDWLGYINPEDTVIGSGVLVRSVKPSGISNYNVDDKLFSVHLNDLWYLNTTRDRPYVLNKDTITNPRKMGMIPPNLEINSTVATVDQTTINLIPSGFNKNGWWGLSLTFDAGDNKWKHDRKHYPNRNEISWWNNDNDLKETDDLTGGDINAYAYMEVSSNKPVAFVKIDGFPSHSGTDPRWLQMRYQIGRGGRSNFGTGTSISDLGITLRMEVELDQSDEATGYYVPDPFLDPDHPEYKGATNVTTSYSLDRTKGARLIYDAGVKPTDQPIMAPQLSIPAGYNISGMAVRISLQPNEWDYSESTAGEPAGRELKDTTIRIHDIRVVDGATSTVSQSLNASISGVRYAVTEIAKFGNREIESIPNGQTQDLYFSNSLGSSFTLTSGTQNSATTHYGIYRSNLPAGQSASGVNVEWNTFGRIGEVPIDKTNDIVFFDNFDVPITVTPDPLIGLIAVSADDQTIVWKLRDPPPPVMRQLTVFKGSIVGISNINRRSLVYSYAAYPESFPDFHAIDYFPLKEKDILVGTHAINNVLIILAEGAVLTMTELPHARLGRLVASDVDVIEGAPGCVSEYGFTECEIDGFPHLAYVSIHGIYLTDGHSAKRISDDLDWNTEVNRTTLNRSKLFFDKDYKHLIFIFDKDADGRNDTKFTFHLDPIHRKAKSGMPKILGPTPAKLNDMVQGQVQQSYRIYSAAANSQSVFVERSGVNDASNSWSGQTNTVPFDIKTGKMYGDWSYLSAIRGNLRHTDWGTSSVISGTWTAGRDDGDNSASVIKTIKTAGHKGDSVFIGRAGEWHQFRLSDSSSTIAGAIHHIKVKVQQHGSDSGDV